tara:strand:+ start:2402 stop:3418 length:1017 start_codon:yes stop_codon:yes gene_type:complete
MNSNGATAGEFVIAAAVAAASWETAAVVLGVLRPAALRSAALRRRSFEGATRWRCVGDGATGACIVRTAGLPDSIHFDPRDRRKKSSSDVTAIFTRAPARAMGGGDAPRGGTRGGKDQFNWEDVKGDKDREYYLGHSLKASVGRWQKGKDILWYTREKGDGGAGAAVSDAERARAEIAAIKAAEEQAMAEALGLKPRTEHHVTRATLEKHEMDELLRRGATKDERTDEVEAARVRGLGVQGVHGGAGREIMEGVGLSDDDDDDRGRAQAVGLKRSREDGEGGRVPLQMTAKELKKEKKRAKKEAKKAKKRLKKEAKRAKKDAKRRGRSPSSSSSSSSS